MSKEQIQNNDTEFSLSSVPPQMKTQGLWAAMVVLVGFTFFTPSMTAGGNLGIGMNTGGFFGAMFIGNMFLGIYCGILGYIGQKTGLTLDLLAHHSFGKKGSYLPSALISVTQIGWFGVGVAMFAIPVAALTGISVWILIILTGIIMTFTAFRGIKALAVLGSVAVPLIALLGIYSINWGIREVNGFANIFSENPDQPLSLAAGIAIVVGSFISGGTATPNFTRFARTAKTAVIATVVAFFVGNSVMMIFGAVGGAVTGVADIFNILILQGLAIPAVITLGLNIWTTNNNALYTAGLGVSNITKVSMKPMVLAGGAVGTITAIWLYYNFVGFLNLLSGMIPPVGAVIVLHYFLHKEEYEVSPPQKQTADGDEVSPPQKQTADGDEVSPPQKQTADGGEVSPPQKQTADGGEVSSPQTRAADGSESVSPALKNYNWNGIIAVLGGALVGIFLNWGIKPLNSLIAATVIFIILELVTRKNRQL